MMNKNLKDKENILNSKFQIFINLTFNDSHI